MVAIVNSIDGCHEMCGDFDNTEYVISGIWDVLSNQEVVDFVRIRIAQRMEPEQVFTLNIDINFS